MESNDPFYHRKTRRNRRGAVPFGATALLLILAVSLAAEGEPDPLVLLRKECVSCHTEAKRKGGLLIDSRESLLKGGDSDAAIVPGKASESYLIELLFPDADPHMPPKGQLKPREIAALETWVNDGAPWDADQWAKLNLPEKREVAPGTLPPRYQPVLAMALSPDRSMLVVGRGSAIDWYRVLTTEGDQPEVTLEYAATSPGHADAVQSLAFSPDGKSVASGGFRSLRVWEVASPETPFRELTEPFLGRQTAILFLGGSKRILVSDSLPSQLGRLHEMALDSGETVTFDTAHRDSIFALVSNRDGTRYASASADKLVTIRDAKTHEIVTRLEGHTSYVMAAAFSPEGNRIATAGDDEDIKVWNLETGKKVGSFGSKNSGPFYGLIWLKNLANEKKQADEKDPEKAAAINTDFIIAIPESGKPASFTDLKEHEGEQRSTGAKERGFDAVESPLFALAVDPESRWTFAGGEDGKLYVWDPNGKLKQTLEPPAAASVVALKDE